MKWIALIAALAGGPALAGAPGPVAQSEFTTFPPREVALGRLLFYDPILSGNRNITCGTCHNPRFGTSDGVSLDIGEGGIGLGPARHSDPKDVPEQRIARNAPGLWNLGAREFSHLFDDGRIEADPKRKSGIRTPLDEEMVRGFRSALAAQAMFPVIAPDEMAGHYGENDISTAVRMGRFTGKGGAWSLIAARVAAIPDYRVRFDAVLGKGKPIAFTDIANMIAAFVATEWRADDSPFDRAMRGGPKLRGPAAAGMALFYGKAGCSVCHSGPFQSDQSYHAIAMPQIGPGKVARFETGHRDVGRMRVTGRAADAYKFRTPSLRNVTLTAPYGHDGAYATLEAVVRHHLDPVVSLHAYDRAQAVFPKFKAKDWAVLDDLAEVARIAAANELAPRHLSEPEVADILAFLVSLTDTGAAKGRFGVPERVPGGLPVDR